MHLLVIAMTLAAATSETPYPWPHNADAAGLQQRIAPPAGFTRVPAGPGTFAAWLRLLPMKPGRPPVRLHNGRKKGNQAAHHAVLDIDVGNRDLQQCADAVIRLRAEYLFAQGKPDAIRFNFTSGDAASFTRWRDGDRPIVKGNTVEWLRTAGRDDSYANFRAYLNTVFAYAGSHSLSAELVPVSTPKEVRAGDVFIQGGFPGHAVIVVDVTHNDESGETCFLLAQSYMPAQDVHILKNPQNPDLSPWYSAGFGEELVTPEWTFRRTGLKRFPDP